MTLIYEGTDITEDVDIIECIHRDVSRGACDLMNIKLDHADSWFRWGPQKNDRIQVKRGGYDSGTLYLNTIAPEDGAYRIYATGAKSAPFQRKWEAFENKTFGAILNLCAAELAMGARVYGVGNATYEYILRENLSAPEFMEKLAAREGAVLKAQGGAFSAIGIGYAQSLPAMHTVKLDSDQMDSRYTRLNGYRWAGVEIKTLFGSGSATDYKGDGERLKLGNITVDNDAMAYRWAKGLLMSHNRKSETLELEMDFNPGYTAMVRIDVESGSDADGKWIIDGVEQNLLEGRTRAQLYRCIETVY